LASPEGSPELLLLLDPALELSRSDAICKENKIFKKHSYISFESY